jgi:hypothetical protein
MSHCLRPNPAQPLAVLPPTAPWALALLPLGVQRWPLQLVPLAPLPLQLLLLAAPPPLALEVQLRPRQLLPLALPLLALKVQLRPLQLLPSMLPILVPPPPPLALEVQLRPLQLLPLAPPPLRQLPVALLPLPL